LKVITDKKSTHFVKIFWIELSRVKFGNFSGREWFASRLNRYGGIYDAFFILRDIWGK